MLWFTYYKGTFSTFVFATQNRAFMLRSVLRTPSGPPGGSRKPLRPEAKTFQKKIKKNLQNKKHTVYLHCIS
jgi:hypothetical protein